MRGWPEEPGFVDDLALLGYGFALMLGMALFVACKLVVFVVRLPVRLWRAW
jgi:hypothetical protein